MGINRGPWGWGRTGTTADMTEYRLKGQQITKGRRAKGQSNPSPEYLLTQAISALMWPVFRQVSGEIRKGWTAKLEKQPAASAWYKYNYAAGLPSGVLSTAALSFAKGVITPTAITAIADASDQEITFTWSPDPADDSQLDTDVLAYVVTNIDRTPIDNGYPAFIGNSPNIARSVGGAVQVFPPGTFATGDNLYLWTFFIGASATLNSGKSETSVRQSIITVA